MSAKLTNPVQRLVFENARTLLQDSGYNWRTAKLTQSFIRSEVLMSTSQSRLHLPVLVTDNQNGNAFNTERRLQLTDVFVVSSINVQVAKPASATDAAYDTFNFADLSVFTTSGVPAAIKGVYKNGYMSMIVDNDQMLPAWDLEWHYRAPETQAGTNTLIAFSGATTVLNNTNSVDGSNDGIVPNEPNFILTGNSNIDFSLNTVNAMAAIETTGRWIVRLRGVLAQNCSKIAS
jgi:hypothetical protein